MEKRQIRLSLETTLYLTILVAAALLRLTKLEWPPLNNAEATLALAAAAETPNGSSFWAGERVIASDAPAYRALTALVFDFRGPTDPIARLVPALAGIGLVVSPLFARRASGRGPMLTMAFILAISPVLIVSSRTAGGLSLSAFGLLLAIALLVGAAPHASWATRGVWIAACLGLMIASGSSAMMGLSGLCLGLAASWLVWRVPALGTRKDATSSMIWRPVLVGLGVAVLVASGFGLAVGGLPGVPDSLASWITGWSSSGPVKALTVPAALVVYEPLTLGLGILGAVRLLRERDTLGRVATAWAVAALGLALAFPSRQASDLIWVVLPLAFLAGHALASLGERLLQAWSWGLHGSLALILTTLAAVAYTHLASYAAGLGPGMFVGDRDLSLRIAASVLGLAVILIVLFGLGWSWPAAFESAALAGFLVLLLASLSAAWNLSFRDGATGSGELWRPEASADGLPMMIQTIGEISQAHTGRMDGLPVHIEGDVPPALAWALRGFRRAEAAQPGSPPEIVLAQAETDLTGLEAEYVGQGMTISERWAWTGPLPPDPIVWWVRRQAPSSPEHWLLLVRSDIATLESR